MQEEEYNYIVSLCEIPKIRLCFSSVYYRLQIPNFFRPKKYNKTEFSINSPTFEFANALWQFEFQPHREAYHEKESIMVSLKRRNVGMQKHRFFHRVLIIDVKDKKHIELCATSDCNTEDGTIDICVLNNKMPFYDSQDTLTLIIHLICKDSTEVSLLKEPINRGILEKPTDCKVFLSEFPSNTLSSVNYIVEVPNLFFPNYNGVLKINSPSFDFANATWQLEFEPIEEGSGYVNDSDDGELRNLGNTVVSLKKLNSETSKHFIFYAIYLKDESEYLDESFTSFQDCIYNEVNNSRCTKVLNFPSTGSETISLIINLVCDELLQENAVKELLTDHRGMDLYKDFKDVLLNGEDHVIFNVQGKEFKGRCDILKAHSDVFRSMLSCTMHENNSGYVNISDCDPEAFEQLLLYIHTGTVKLIDENNMFSLYHAADKYNISDLREKCREFLVCAISETNVCQIFDFAEKHSDSKLSEIAVNYFFSNADSILTTPEWHLFMKENSIRAKELTVKSSKGLKTETSS